jgi:hypothetical protein
MALIRIAFAPDLGVALVMKSLLESEGIFTPDIASGGHVSIAGADQGYYIEVLDEDASRAIQLLRENSFGKHLSDEFDA